MRGSRFIVGAALLALVGVANADGVSGTMQITSAMITAALGFTPPSNALTSAHIYVGNGSAVATDTAMTGACTITNAGAISCPLTTGSVPVGSTGSCVASSFTGGATAGKFSAAVCAGGTIILSSLPTAPNGWTCDAQDQTTSSDTLKQTANTVTSVTFTATTVAADVVVFKCLGW